MIGSFTYVCAYVFACVCIGFIRYFCFFRNVIYWFEYLGVIELGVIKKEYERDG